MGNTGSRKILQLLRLIREWWNQVSDKLRVLQVPFRNKLLENVVEFIEEVKEFRGDFEKNGPMQPGTDLLRCSVSS